MRPAIGDRVVDSELARRTIYGREVAYLRVGMFFLGVR